MDGSPSSVSKLIDLLPLIIISVIVLVGFFTWEIFTKHLETFILLITSVLFAIWLYSGDIYSYITWRDASGTDQFFPEPSEGPPEISTMIMTIIIVGVVFVLGIGLTLAITSYQIGNKIGSASQNTSVLQYLGYGFMGVGGIVLISLLWKAFRGSSTDDAKDKNATSTFGSTIAKVIGSLLFSITGIYFFVKSKQIETEKSQEVNDSSSEANSLSIANTVLNAGLIFQVVALLAGIYLMYRYKWFHPDLKNSTSPFLATIGRFAPFVLFLAAGMIFIAVQQKWIKSDEGIGSGDDKNNMYVAHGIVYLTLAGITLLIALGKLSTFNLFKGAGWISSLGVIGVIIWNFITLNQTSNFNLAEDDEKNGNAYYQQVKDEVTKELKKSGKPEDVTDDKIRERMNERMGELNSSNDQAIKTVNNSLLGVALAITIAIGILYAAKMKIVECMKLPANIKNIFVGDCVQNPNDFKENSVLKSKLSGDAANIEKMNSDDWGKILETYNDETSELDTNFSVLAVVFAQMSRWIPFLTIILVVTCVSILFTKVTTSEATMDWIAESFRGEMFPKVKELLDTFFIVFIVGLLLCAILLLPMVREQNVGGLDIFTKFIDSIQVWQYKENKDVGMGNYVLALVGPAVVWFIGLSWWLNHLRTRKENEDAIPESSNWGWAIAAVSIFAFCCIPAFYHVVTAKPHETFEKDHRIVRVLRLFLTSAYLVPLLFFSIFKLILYFIPFFIGNLFNKPEWGVSFTNEKAKLDFTKWKAATGSEPNQRGTDLRMFGLGKILTPDDVIMSKAATVASASASASAKSPSVSVPGIDSQVESVDQTKVNAVGKLIKVIFIVILVVIMILIIIYTVYRIGAQEKNPGTVTDTNNPEDPGIIEKMNSPTAHTIYIIMAIVGIAGIVAYLREKFKETNSKTPEDYVFNDLKPEDSNSPMRQLTFGMTHIIYIVLIVIVLIYDREKDDKDRMSVTGLTILGILILLFHYLLEMADNKLPPEPPRPGEPADEKPRLAPMINLLSNIRFIVNTVFLIILCVLAYYKQHSLMIALIVIMFLFHLTKSILGIKFLKLLWACIIYIPCLFLDLLQSFQGTVGDTTRTIWVIVAIELLLIAILYGGPYLLNYIGATGSQIVAAPITIKQKYDTKMNTQSKEIFIFHNTGIDRTPEDKAADCPIEEKKRYQYSISGWFFLNNNVTSKSTDLEIFNFGDVPKMTYNVAKNELKIHCNTLNAADKGSKTEVIYNSRTNYNSFVNAQKSSEEKKTNTEEKKAIVKMSIEDEELDSDVPLQRWNYFVINYDGKNMDFFLNNKLVFKSNFIMPDILLKPITIGDTKDNKGLNGSICNFAFHKYPLTKEQIRWTYTMLRSQNPPIIGSKTIEDEVKATGTTTIYSQ